MKFLVYIHDEIAIGKYMLSRYLSRFCILSSCMFTNFLGAVSFPTCHTLCKNCNNNGNGPCVHYCSKSNYCGKELVYRPEKGGADCRGCNKKGKKNDDLDLEIDIIHLNFITLALRLI